MAYSSVEVHIYNMTSDRCSWFTFSLVIIHEDILYSS